MKFKRIAVVICLAAMLTACFAGCNQDGNSSSEVQENVNTVDTVSTNMNGNTSAQAEVTVDGAGSLWKNCGILDYMIIAAENELMWYVDESTLDDVLINVGITVDDEYYAKTVGGVTYKIVYSKSDGGFIVVSEENSADYIGVTGGSLLVEFLGIEDETEPEEAEGEESADEEALFEELESDKSTLETLLLEAVNTYNSGLEAVTYNGTAVTGATVSDVLTEGGYTEDEIKNILKRVIGHDLYKFVWTASGTVQITGEGYDDAEGIEIAEETTVKELAQ